MFQLVTSAMPAATAAAPANTAQVTQVGSVRCPPGREEVIGESDPVLCCCVDVQPDAFADVVLRGNPGDVLGLAHLAMTFDDPLFGDRRGLELEQDVGEPIDREGEASGNGDGHVPP